MNREIISSQDRIENLFTRYKSSDDDLLKRDMAKYICVLVSGYIEHSMRMLICDYSSGKSSPIIQHYVDSNVKRITNCHYNKIVDILDRFNPPWADDFKNKIQTKEMIANQYKDSINSIISTRHQIAHGKNTGITLSRIEQYYVIAKETVTVLDTSIK